MKNLLLLVTLFIFTGAHAQTTPGKTYPAAPPAYVPYHVYFEQHVQNYADISGNARSLGPQVTYSHYTWVDSTSVWSPFDSAYFSYNRQGYNNFSQTYRYLTGSWNYITRRAHSYDAHGNVLSDTLQQWDSGLQQWDNYSTVGYTYNAGNFNTSTTYQNWYDYLSSYRNIFRRVNSYDVSNNQIATLSQNWDTTYNTWINNTYDTTGYFAPGKVSYTLQLTWNTGTSSWDTVNQTEATYNNNGYQLSDTGWYTSSGPLAYNSLSMDSYDMNNNLLWQKILTWSSGWNNSYSNLYAYDANNNDTLDMLITWLGSSWDTIYRYSYTYNGSNLRTSATVQNYSNSAWSPSSYQTFSYDNRGNETQVESFVYNNGWVPSYQFQYTYNAGNQHTYELYQPYDTATHSFVNQDEYFYYWPATSAITELQHDIPATLYPNPGTGDNMNLQFTMDAPTGVAITLYDAQGRLLRTDKRNASTGNNIIPLHYPGLPTGTYFVQLLDRGTGNASTLVMVRE